jgi:2-keto-4-pentenoate hydratase/2-oxohepta-3-ene-1,7-dioic acid hydratase in catechol pathway
MPDDLLEAYGIHARLQPPPVAELFRGDVVELEVGGIGVLRNRIGTR